MEMELHYIPINENIKRVNIMVFQNHRLKNVDSVAKVDGHQDPFGPVLPP
jgi:hypothetical protein